MKTIHIHCSKCAENIPRGQCLEEFARLSVALVQKIERAENGRPEICVTEVSVVCVRHGVLVTRLSAAELIAMPIMKCEVPGCRDCGGDS